MMAAKRKTSLARIEVEKCFCSICSECIKDELQKASGINNIRLYPNDSLITFNFHMANALSEALNVLSSIGYPEKGEHPNNNGLLKSFCSC